MGANAVMAKTKSLIFGICSALIFLLCLINRIEQSKTRSFDLEFDKARIPYLKTTLNDVEGYFLIDLGADLNCSLSAEHLCSIKQLTPLTPKKFINFSNTIFEVNQHYLKEATFLDLKLEDLIISEEINSPQLYEIQMKSVKHVFTPQKFLDKNLIKGSIGHRILKNLNIFIDFKKNQLKLFPPDFIPLFNFPHKNLWFFKKTAFQYVENLGYVCSVMLNGSVKKLLLDTGSSFSLIKKSASKNLVSDKEIIAPNSDSISVELQLGCFVCKHQFMYVSEQFNLKDLDGLLGMDFFYNKAIFIDEARKVLYITD